CARREVSRAYRPVGVAPPRVARSPGRRRSHRHRRRPGGAAGRCRTEDDRGRTSAAGLFDPVGACVPSLNMRMSAVRKEFDSLGEVDVPADRLWGAQTQRSLEHFSIGHDLIPREMITAYATLKKAAANANHTGGRLDAEALKLIVQACDEIL